MSQVSDFQSLLKCSFYYTSRYVIFSYDSLVVNTATAGGLEGWWSDLWYHFVPYTPSCVPLYSITGLSRPLPSWPDGHEACRSLFFVRQSVCRVPIHLQYLFGSVPIRSYIPAVYTLK